MTVIMHVTDEGTIEAISVNRAALAVAILVTAVWVAGIFSAGFTVGRTAEAQLALDAFGREAHAWGLLQGSVEAGTGALWICESSDAALKLQLGQLPTPIPPAPLRDRVTATGGT